MAEGGQTWSIMLGDFEVKNGRPALENVRVVGKPYGAYETQPWSPDGKGFLFFAAGGYKSPYQATPPGWGNARVYYMRLYGKGASPAHPRVTLIGDNAPLYQEQAIFTPDMRTVVMMSNRAATLGILVHGRRRRGAANQIRRAGYGLDADAAVPGRLQRSGLPGRPLRGRRQDRAIRRLTYINRVIPEFYWNDDYTKIIWGLGGDRTALSYVGPFRGITRAQRRVPRVPRPRSGPAGRDVASWPSGAADSRSGADRQRPRRRFTPEPPGARLPARRQERRRRHDPRR